MRFVVLAALLAGVASAQDAQLAALHGTLVELRAQAPDADTMGASEKLTVANHQLRDWIEGQLASLKDGDDTTAFAVQINEALKRVTVGAPWDDQNFLGSIDDVRVERQGILIVTTGVGILCQSDESAYGYQYIDGEWRRVWESEQNDYRKEQYHPQIITAVHVWQRYENGRESGPPFVMTLGHLWGCASTWHDVTYRVWRVDKPRPKLLIDGLEPAWMRTGTFIVGSISQRYDHKTVDALIEFTQGAIDVGVHNREVVRHFVIDGDRITRVDPVALSPRDFVDEWLRRPWEESARWSASVALKQPYNNLHSNFGSAQFGETMHCATPDLWQVSLTPTDSKRNFAELPKRYLLVRWRPPYHFTMVGISDKPWARCTEIDPDADAWRTLFNTQDWRR